jgi:hypothetical protein
MFNGFRGFRGWAYPFRYPGDDMTLGYAVAAHSDFAQPFASTAARTFDFYRLYGDADGDGDVDAADVALFRTTFGKSAGDTAYLPFFDFNGDGKIDSIDLQQLRSRLGMRIVLGAAMQTASAIARARLMRMGETP